MDRSLLILALLSCLLFVTSCDESEDTFESLSGDGTGITFENRLHPTNDLNILTYLYYYNGAGVAIADYTNDGLDDIYFTCNQCSDQIYINQGNFQFKEISQQAGIKNADGWTSGVAHVDINGDGWEDIYISKVGNYRGITGRNLLYINTGLSEEGIPQFEEQAEEYGLDIVAFSTQSSFFDYDLDGDLDLFLLSHSVHPNRTYGNGSNREVSDSLSGDRLYENLDGQFVDVTQQSGIFQSKIGYGLGVSIADINNDGYPDIYVGNDFFENDYLYINIGDKTFQEIISTDPKRMGHTSHYSMGNTLVDLNNDGNSDLVSLDMLPEDIFTLKASGSEDPFSIYERFLKNNYSPQYMQNTLHFNKGNGLMSEVGYQSGIAATEWSWGVLGADFDLDGYKDLYITNGILGATNDMDYVNFIVQDDIQKSIEEGENGILSMTSKIPQKHVSNYFFKNSGKGIFEDVTTDWFEKRSSFSNGSAYADLDNDGDLDLVVNNANEPAMVLRNMTMDRGGANYLKIRLIGDGSNSRGIGAKLKVYIGKEAIYDQHYPVKSYLSASSNDILVGLGARKVADSVEVLWPNGLSQTIQNVSSNQVLTFNQTEAIRKDASQLPVEVLLNNTDLEIRFAHSDETTLDFDYDPLVPFALSNEGPDIAIADINGDGLDDLLITGAKHQSSQVYYQSESGELVQGALDSETSFAIHEDIGSHFFDADQDGDLDLIIVSGGNEFANGLPLKPRFYLNDNGQLSYQPELFGELTINASAVTSFDFEGDGDLDLVITSDGMTRQFGHTPTSYILLNDGKGHFSRANDALLDGFGSYGNYTDLTVIDIDGNGYQDLVCVGDWMPITIFLNEGGTLKKSIIQDTEGWWNAVAVCDCDKDGDQDLIAGNWGHNTRLKASAREPINLYSFDFDANGQRETIITYYYGGKEVLLASKDELTRQLPSIKKKYLSYQAFAKANLDEIFDTNQLRKSLHKEVKTLSSALFVNDGKLNFTMRELPFGAQSSTVNDIMVDDINDDGFDDLLLVGNNYEISTQLGRLDASHGVLLLNDQNGFFKEQFIQNYDIAGPARGIEKISVGNTEYYIIGINNDRPVFIKKMNSNE